MFLRLLEQVVFGFKGEIYNVLNLLLTAPAARVRRLVGAHQRNRRRDPAAGAETGVPRLPPCHP